MSVEPSHPGINDASASSSEDEVSSLRKRQARLERSLLTLAERRAKSVDPHNAPSGMDEVEMRARDELERVQARLAELTGEPIAGPPTTAFPQPALLPPKPPAGKTTAAAPQKTNALASNKPAWGWWGLILLAILMTAWLVFLGLGMLLY